MKYDYIVLYSSKTGNTKKLATEIFSMLPGINKELKALEDVRRDQETDVYLLGFWVDMGYMNPEMLEFLAGLKGKKIILFGTCGMGHDEDYYKELRRRVYAAIPEGNVCLGCFLCQGRMPMTVRRKYEEMYAGSFEKEKVARMLYNFDQAMLHPNKEDFDSARLFVNGIMDELGVPREIEIK